MSATFQRTALLYLFQLKTFVCIESYLSDLQEGPKGSRSSVNNPLINSMYRLFDIPVFLNIFQEKNNFFNQLKNEGSL